MVILIHAPVGTGPLESLPFTLSGSAATRRIGQIVLVNGVAKWSRPKDTGCPSKTSRTTSHIINLLVPVPASPLASLTANHTANHPTKLPARLLVKLLVKLLTKHKVSPRTRPRTKLLTRPSSTKLLANLSTKLLANP